MGLPQLVPDSLQELFVCISDPPTQVGNGVTWRTCYKREFWDPFPEFHSVDVGRSPKILSQCNTDAVDLGTTL